MYTKVVWCVQQAVISINYAFYHFLGFGAVHETYIPMRRQIDSVNSRTH